jgi:hypothetical protein
MVKSNAFTGGVVDDIIATTGTFSGAVGLSNGTALLPALIPSADPNTGVWFPAADTVAVSTAGVERLRADASGNLGLGVTPSAWFSGWSPALQMESYAVSSDANTNYISNNAVFGADTTWRYMASKFALHTEVDSASGQFRWYTAPSGTAGNAISFSQAMTLDASGNLLVGSGTVISGTNLARGYIYNNTATQAGFQSAVGATHTGAYPIGAFSTVQAFNAAHVALIVQSGNGSSITANRFAVYTDGSAQNVTGTYGSALSDIRLKENITPATPKLDKLMQLEVINYNVIGEEEKLISFSAQQMQTIFPSLVTVRDTRVFDEDGNALSGLEDQLGLKVGMEFALLTKAMQEQQAIIAALTERLEALERA